MKRLPHLPGRVWTAMAIPFVLLAIGTVGYKSLAEPGEWSWFDALYMTAITLTTVGYGETHELNFEGRVFTIGFLFGGVYVLFFAVSEMIRSVVSGEFRASLGREGVNKALAQIKDHVIVCGLGRMGMLVCQEFERHNMSFVVVDQVEELLKEMGFNHGLPVHGDAADDEILKRAGVGRARTLVTVLPSDADNLYVTLSARVLNANLQIVARAEHESTEQKLRRVGANQVVAPYLIGGHRVAQAVLRPSVGRFLDQATRPGLDAYHIEEVLIRKESTLAGKSLRETDLGTVHGVVVITMCRPNGEVLFNPRGDTEIEAGVVLIVVGQKQQLQSLKALAAGG